MLRGRHKHIILFSKSCDVQFFSHIFWWRPGHLHIGYVRGVLGWSLTFVHWSSLIDRTATTLQLLVVNRNPFLAIRSSHELCWSYCLIIWEDEIYWIIVLHFCRRIWVCCQKNICGMQSIVYSTRWYGMFFFQCLSHRGIVAAWYACLIISQKSLRTTAAALCSTTVMSLQLADLVKRRK